jgi:ATP-dependent Clp protease ATP-binding subunit ClpA
MTLATVRPLTTRTRISLAIARAVAAARGDHNLTPIHITLGVFREGANPAVAALYNAGVQQIVLQRLATELEATLGDPPGGTNPRQVVLDLTSGEEEALIRGDVEAELLNDDYLGTEHILLAILRASSDELTTFLAKRGITAEVLSRGISAMRSGRPPA